MPPLQQTLKELSRSIKKILLTLPISNETFTVLDFEDAEEFGFLSKWAELYKQTDRRGVYLMKKGKHHYTLTDYIN